MTTCGCTTPDEAARCRCRKPSPVGMPPMRAGGVCGLPARAGGIDPLAAIGAFVNGAGAAAGNALCSFAPIEARQAILDIYLRNADLFDNPFFQWIVGPWPTILIETARTCNVAAGARQGACVVMQSADIVLAMAPLAGALTTTFALPLAVPIAIEAGLAAVIEPIARTLCLGRLPSLDDYGRLIGALSQATAAATSGDFSASMAVIQDLGQKSIASGEKDPTKALKKILRASDSIAAIKRATLKDAAKAAARTKARAVAQATAHLQALALERKRQQSGGTVADETTTTKSGGFGGALVGAGAGALLGGPLGALVGAGAGFALAHSPARAGGSDDLHSALTSSAATTAQNAGARQRMQNIGDARTPLLNVTTRALSPAERRAQAQADAHARARAVAQQTAALQAAAVKARDADRAAKAADDASRRATQTQSADDAKAAVEAGAAADTAGREAAAAQATAESATAVAEVETEGGAVSSSSSGFGGALVGAGAGALLGGPLGALVGAGAGFVLSHASAPRAGGVLDDAQACITAATLRLDFAGAQQCAVNAGFASVDDFLRGAASTAGGNPDAVQRARLKQQAEDAAHAKARQVALDAARAQAQARTRGASSSSLGGVGTGTLIAVGAVGVVGLILWSRR